MLGLLIALASAVLGAGPEELLEHHRNAGLVSADPDAASFALVWLEGPRAKAALDIVLPGSSTEVGFFYSLLPLIELANPGVRDVTFPSAIWRGRASLKAGWRWLSQDALFVVSSALEHESDHSTWPVSHPVLFRGRVYSPVYSPLQYSGRFTGAFLASDFYSLQDFAVRGDVALPIQNVEGLILSLTFEFRTFVASCNQDVTVICERFGRGLGIEPRGELVADLRLAPWISAYAALALSELNPIQALNPERRLVLRLGVHGARSEAGVFQGFFVVFTGNDTGIDRAATLTQAGFGVGWSP
jgi:hypothetical protein